MRQRVNKEGRRASQNRKLNWCLCKVLGQKRQLACGTGGWGEGGGGDTARTAHVPFDPHFDSRTHPRKLLGECERGSKCMRRRRRRCGPSRSDVCGMWMGGFATEVRGKCGAQVRAISSRNLYACTAGFWESVFLAVNECTNVYLTKAK